MAAGTPSSSTSRGRWPTPSASARHSPPSSPIPVEGAREGGALSVSDEGRGIASDRVPHLFRKRAGLAGGTGLGLAISKGLVEAHGGRIRAESGGAGLGARFTFTIPAAGWPQAPCRDEGREAAHGKGSTVRLSSALLGFAPNWR